MDVREFASFLVGKVTLRKELCVRSLSPRASCRRCVESCPLDSIEITEKGPQIADCNRCGLCAAACPTGALKDPERTPAFFLARGREILKHYEEVIFFCLRLPPRIRQDKTPNAVFVPCLGALIPEVLLALATEGKVLLVLPREGCAGCALEKGRSIYENTLFLVNKMLEALQFSPERIRVTSEVPPLRVKSLSKASGEAAMGRREFFAALFRGINRGVIQENSGQGNIPASRRQILDQVLEDVEKAKGSLRKDKDWPQAGLKVAGPCYFCNVCSRLCPTGALTLQEEKLLFSPALCLSCGLCIDVCLHGSLSWGDKISLNSLVTKERQELTIAGIRECVNCGEKFSGNTYARLCLRCLLQKGLIQ
ncbi:DUF362 domain-containing protein [Thermanaeromonas sp.]|uniref:DUF362 domain-containing protein n=1 Tax=Thermanaeromonas sp. TaxID=2003697 RepID=UPI00260C7758|nr:4Fe-4S dicluster domain-containing protein [Thermanaeromonas sp.]